VTVEARPVLERYRPHIDHALARLLLPAAPASLGRLVEAMRYSLEAPGKRLRPALCLAACEAVGGRPERAESAAGALELIHTYSLIHDDLPCMDDDDTRRGRPTSHRVFGEALAVLAGDGLLTRAFGVLAEDDGLTPETRCAMIETLAEAAGHLGMVGGQALDLAAEGEAVDPEGLREIHARKTGALIAASCRLGALAGGAAPGLVEALGRFGQELGLAFQIRDDLLDETGTTEALGKNAGRDRERGKATYPGLLGLEASRERMREAAARARAAIVELGERAEPLEQLTRIVVERSS